MKPPAAFAIAVTVILCAATEASMAVEIDEIRGSWRLVTVDGQTVGVEGETPGFTIEGDAISGYDGCNRFSGPLDNPAAMIVGQRACAGDYVALPLDLADPKAHLAEATLDGERLMLPGRRGLPPAEFERER